MPTKRQFCSSKIAETSEGSMEWKGLNEDRRIRKYKHSKVQMDSKELPRAHQSTALVWPAPVIISCEINKQKEMI